MALETISYQIIRSARKTISIQIVPPGQVVVRCPNRMKNEEIRTFVQSKADWIEKHLQKFSGSSALPPFTPEQVKKLAAQALKVIPERVAYFAPKVGVTHGNITIRNQRTRWGSCSGKGNLNFNCLLMLAPPEVLDYVVVHELCHLKELNHSPRFWREVAKIIPDYNIRRKWLKEQGRKLVAKL